MASLFTKIAEGKIPGTILYQDERCFAFLDIKPEAPMHFLVVPRKELSSMNAATAEDEALIGHLFVVAAKVAFDRGFAASGYRLVINVGAQAGQSVDHLHVHVLGGRPLGWPPG